MKKKLSMIVFEAVLIAFTCMYAIVDKNNAIYDRAVDTSQYVALGLEQGEMVSQSFVSTEDKLDVLISKCRCQDRLMIRRSVMC